MFAKRLPDVGGRAATCGEPTALPLGCVGMLEEGEGGTQQRCGGPVPPSQVDPSRHARRLSSSARAARRAHHGTDSREFLVVTDAISGQHPISSRVARPRRRTYIARVWGGCVANKRTSQIVVRVGAPIELIGDEVCTSCVRVSTDCPPCPGALCTRAQLAAIGPADLTIDIDEDSADGDIYLTAWFCR
jgi:hypothetical protein